MIQIAKQATGIAILLARFFLTIFWALPLLAIRALAGKDFADGVRSVVIPRLKRESNS